MNGCVVAVPLVSAQSCMMMWALQGLRIMPPASVLLLLEQHCVALSQHSALLKAGAAYISNPASDIKHTPTLTLPLSHRLHVWSCRSARFILVMNELESAQITWLHAWGWGCKAVIRGCCMQPHHHHHSITTKSCLQQKQHLCIMMWWMWEELWEPEGDDTTRDHCIIEQPALNSHSDFFVFSCWHIELFPQAMIWGIRTVWTATTSTKCRNQTVPKPVPSMWSYIVLLVLKETKTIGCRVPQPLKPPGPPCPALHHWIRKDEDKTQCVETYSSISKT